jgi:hypothetical protein
MSTVTFKDGFKWKVLDADAAISLFSEGGAELFALYADESESLITNAADLMFYVNTNHKIAIEIGY